MVKRLPLSKFRFAIAEVVRNAERGQPTVLTDYGRDVAAVVPLDMLHPTTDNPPPEKKSPAFDQIPGEAKNQAS